MTAPPTKDPATEELRANARATVHALIELPEWEAIASRALVLLTRPPTPEWAQPVGDPAAWIILDAAEARALAPERREALLRDGYRYERQGPTAPLELHLFTAEAVDRLLDGVVRRTLEARWTVRAAEAVHDPLHHNDALRGAAGRMPADGLERIVRPLFTQAATALHALAGLPEDATDSGLVLMGEAAAAVARLACVLEEGMHPPTEWLLPAARRTHLGGRVSSWLDDLSPAIAGEARAVRWVRESAPGVLREVAAVLRSDFQHRDWLREPEAQTYRPTRQ